MSFDTAEALEKRIAMRRRALPSVGNVKGQGKDTLGRKKSTGRPKGGGRKERIKHKLLARLDEDERGIVTIDTPS